MITILQQSQRKAAKNYHCDACSFLFNEDISDLKLTFSEKLAVVRARNNGYKIMKGESYIYQFNRDDNGREAWTYRAIPEIHEICIKYELFSNW